MKIVLDAMGSDAGATPLVQGAVMAAKHFPVEIILTGREYSLKRLLRHFRYTGNRIHVVGCSQTVAMHEKPKASLRKTDSSIAVGTKLVLDGMADALVSAGNTGATKAHTLMSWRRLPGITREGIATVMPTPEHPSLLIDVGASVDCKPQHLVDFAVMGSVYSREILGQKNPRVGVLSVGEEPGKGNELTLATYKLLEQTQLNFIGNVEGRDILKGTADVVVCDGFVGNALLKFGEQLARMIMTGIKGAMTKNVLTLGAALILSPGLRSYRRRIDYAEYGGAPLLGLNGICIIGHGASSPKAIMNAIRVAKESVDHGVNRRISEEIVRVKALLGDANENGKLPAEGSQIPSITQNKA